MKAISEYIGKHFRNVELQPSIVETCMYTVSHSHNILMNYYTCSIDASRFITLIGGLACCHREYLAFLGYFGRNWGILFRDFGIDMGMLFCNLGITMGFQILKTGIDVCIEIIIEPLVGTRRQKVS